VTAERVVRADPSTAVVSLVRPDRFDDVRAEVCELGNFLPSREAASEWLATYPQGMLSAIAEEFDLAREVMKGGGLTSLASAAANIRNYPQGGPKYEQGQARHRRRARRVRGWMEHNARGQRAVDNGHGCSGRTDQLR